MKVIVWLSSYFHSSSGLLLHFWLHWWLHTLILPVQDGVNNCPFYFLGSMWMIVELNSCTHMFLRMNVLFLCYFLFILFLCQEPTRPAIPILLAVGAVHQHLIQNGLRMSASIVADTAQCFSTHQFACLIGYGARLFLHSKTN